MYKGKTDSMGEDILELLQVVYNIQPNTEIFEYVKKQTLSNFKKAYKGGAFRGYYKAFEMADLNKGFKLKLFYFALPLRSLRWSVRFTWK